MSNQILISSGAKLRDLDDVIIGTDGVLTSLGFNVANGVPKLDENGKILVSQLPNSVMEFKGVWNAATNTPTLADGTGNAGDVYLCNVAGTVNFGSGPIAFAVGDYAVYTGTVWARSSGATGTVTSVGLSRSGDALTVTGSPITTSGTINIGFAGTNTQYINGAGNLVTFPTIAQEAQRLITEVYNETGATLTKGTVVYINGGHGNLPTITKAIATGDATSAQTYGIVQNDIGNNNNGFVVVIGSLMDLDTQAYPDGTQLYLSSTTAGAYTSVKQYAPAHLVYVGIVTRSHPTQGVIEVRIQNGFEMDELHNVAAQNPDNNDILQYKTSTSLWTKVAGTTSNIAEGSNLYFTDARARQSISLTTTGSTGAATYDNTTGVLNIPNYVDQYVGTVTSVGLSAPTGFSVTGSPVTSSGTLALSFASGYSLPTNVKQSNWDDAYTFVANFPTQTGNSGKFLTTDGSSLSWATVIAGVQSVTASSPLSSSGGANPNITIQVATTSQNGYLSSTDWNTFNSKQPAGNYVTLDTAQTISGAKTFTSNIQLGTVGTGTSTATPLTINLGDTFSNTAGANLKLRLFAAVDGVYGIGVSSGQMDFNIPSSAQYKFWSANAIFTNNVTAAALIKSGGTSSQFLKADGSVDSNTYALASALGDYLPLTAGSTKPLTGNLYINSNTGGLYLNRTAITDYSGIAFSTNATFKWFSGMREIVGAGDDYIIFNTPNNVNALRINSTSSIVSVANSMGVGTISPQTFAGYNTLEVSATSGGVIFAKSTTGSITTQLVADNGTSNGYVGTRTNHPFTIRTNNVDRVEITSTGAANFINSISVNHAINFPNSNVAPTGAGIYQGLNTVQIVSGSSGFTINNDANTVVNFRVSNAGVTTLSGGLNGTNAIFSSSVAAGGLISTSYGIARIQVTSTTNSENAGFRLGAKDSAGTAKTAGLYYVAGTTNATTFLSLSANDNDYYFNVLANGNVGIGTTTPTNKLTISNNGNSAIAFRINDTNANASFLSLNASNTDSAIIAGGTAAIPFDIYTGGSKRLTVSASGNLGLGTDAPTERFHINSPSTNAAFIRFQNTGGSGVYIGGRNDNMELYAGGANRITIGNTGIVTVGGAVSGGGTLQVQGNVNINGVFQINGTTIGGGGGSGVTGSGTTNYLTKWTGASTIGNGIMYDTGSRVGVGTTTPNVKFEILSSPSTNPTLGTASGNLMLSDNNLWGMLFGLNGTTGHGWIQQMRVDGATAYPLMLQPVGSNVLIGTFTDNGYRVNLNGSISFAFGYLSVYRGSSSPNDILVGNSGSVFYIGGSTQVVGSVSASGGFFDTSDARLKTLVENNYLLSSIANVKARLYIKDGRKELGYYAQDINEILPSAVKEGSDGFLSLSYAQVHTAKIAVIEDEVTILKNRVSELEKQLNLN